MVGSDATAAGASGPGSSTPEQLAGQGIQSGGFTPQARAIIDALPEDQRSILDRELRQKESFVQAERQRMQRDLQAGQALRDLLKDPEFRGYLEAKEAGTQATFYREQLQLRYPDAAAGQAGDQETDTLGVSGEVIQNPPGPNQNGQNQVGLLLQRIDQLEGRVSTHDSAARDREMAAFAEAHPDYETYLAGMQAEKNALGGAGSFETWYTLAKQSAHEGSAESPPAEGVTQQRTQQGQTATPPANLSERQPPVPVGVSPQSTAAPEGQAETIAEAFRRAKAAHGIEGTVQVDFQA